LAPADAAIAPPSPEFVSGVDKLLAEVLLWAQGVHAAAGCAAPADPTQPPPACEKIADWAELLDKQLGSARLSGIGARFLALTHDLARLTDADAPSAKAAAMTLGALAPPMALLSAAAARVAGDFVAFHKSTAKLCGTLAGVFSGLARDGFCAPPGESENAAEGGELLDDQAGTGIGAGEGKKDVSDEIEDEAQVLGMEDMQKDDTAQPPPGDEAGGLEMGADFEGDMHELEHDAEEEDEKEPPAETAEDQLDKQVRFRFRAVLRRAMPCLLAARAGYLWRRQKQHCVDDRRFTNTSERNLMAESKGLSSAATPLHANSGRGSGLLACLLLVC
jgi:hypothetical protein